MDLKKYRIGQELNDEDRELMYDLMSKSKNYAQLASRRPRLIVGQTGRFNVRCVIASYNNSLIPVTRSKLNAPPCARAKSIRACRELIEPQIVEFRSQQKGPTRGMHVDHIYPFIRLVDDWCAIHRLDLSKLNTKKRRSDARWVFKSEKLNQSWIAYHAEHARLQMLSAKENLRKGAKILA